MARRYAIFSAPESTFVAHVYGESADEAFEQFDEDLETDDVLLVPSNWGHRIVCVVDDEKSCFGYLVAEPTTRNLEFVADGRFVMLDAILVKDQTLVADCAPGAEVVAQLFAAAPRLEMALCRLAHDLCVRGGRGGVEFDVASLVQALTAARSYRRRPELLFYLAVLEGRPIPQGEIEP